MSVTFRIKASEAWGRRLDPEYHHALRDARVKSSYPTAKLLSLSYFRTGGTPSTAHPEYWNGSIPWVPAKDFKTFRFDDSEDHVTELAIAGINAVHEKGCCQAVPYVRRTIQNGWRRGVLHNWLSTGPYEWEGNKITPCSILGCDVRCLSMSRAALSPSAAAKSMARSFGQRCKRWTELREEGGTYGEREK